MNTNLVSAMMQSNPSGQDNQTHPDLRRAVSGLMLQDQDLSSATGCNSWQKLHESHPVFASRVSDKNNLFAMYRGTAVGKCDWKSNSLSVSDMRLVFPTEKECMDYHVASLKAHPELFMKGKDDAMIPSMVEMRIEGSEEHFKIGTHCKIYCGPTNEARERMIESLTRGKTEQEQKFLVERASQVVKLVYLFCVGRTLCKLSVSTDNGLYPLGHARSLAIACKSLSEKWQNVACASQSHLYAKNELRKAFLERAKLHQSELENPSGGSDHSRNQSEAAYFPVGLFVAAVGEGVLDASTPNRVLERLQHASLKVPKEQIIRISLQKDSKAEPKKHKDLVEDEEIKLRVFVSNSEDAKAVQGYISSHGHQCPAPLVILCPHLAVAMEYDSSCVDITNQGTADRLRKQAKTRAVKLMRELLVENVDKLSKAILGGHMGPTATIGVLAESIKKRCQVINDKTGEQGVVFASGSKGNTAASTSAGTAVDDNVEVTGDGLDCLLQLADQALKDAAASSASSTPSAVTITADGKKAEKVQWDSKEFIGEFAGLLRSGKRRAPPLMPEDGASAAERQKIVP